MKKLILVVFGVLFGVLGCTPVEPPDGPNTVYIGAIKVPDKGITQAKYFDTKDLCLFAENNLMTAMKDSQAEGLTVFYTGCIKVELKKIH